MVIEETDPPDKQQFTSIRPERTTGPLRANRDSADDHVTSTSRVRERTGDPTDPSVNDVFTLALIHAEHPRTDESLCAHLDHHFSAVIAKHGTDAVRECVHLVLVDGYPDQVAGRDALENPIDGIYAATAARAYLRQCRAKRQNRNRKSRIN